MSKQQLYHQLLHHEKQLKALWNSTGVEQFVGLMQGFLHWPELTFNELIDFLQQQNQQFLLPELDNFSRYWQPAEYKKRDQSISWVPAFQPLQQPFYLDDMTQQRGNLLAQLIRPVTRVLDLLPQRHLLPAIAPALLIFHWSRCGSTLLGGLYRQLDSVKLLSESMLISDMLLDSHWPDDIKSDLLQLSICLQGRFRHGEQQLVVKCNAWDLQHWQLWLQQFPQARVLCLGRQPEHILRSHQRMAGLHMAGVAGVWQQAFSRAAQTSLLNRRIEVLHRLMWHTEQLLAEPHTVFLDYQQLLLQPPQQLAAYLQRDPNSEELERWQCFSRRDAKQPDIPFQAADSAAVVAFTTAEKQQISAQLTPLYTALLQRQLVAQML